MIETLAGNQNEFHVGNLVDPFTFYIVCVLVGSLLYLPYWKRKVKEKQVIKQALKTFENVDVLNCIINPPFILFIFVFFGNVL